MGGCQWDFDFNQNAPLYFLGKYQIIQNTCDKHFTVQLFYTLPEVHVWNHCNSLKVALCSGWSLLKWFCGHNGIHFGATHCGHRWTPQGFKSNPLGPTGLKRVPSLRTLAGRKASESLDKSRESVRQNKVDSLLSDCHWRGKRSDSVPGRRPPKGVWLFVSLLLEGPRPDLHHTSRKLICRAANRVSCGWGKTTDSSCLCS